MTTAHRATRQPFTVVCCGGCSGADELKVLDALGQSIRRCPHGVLARTGCLLGPLTCATHRHGPGVMVVLQPCTADRRPFSQARWVGPIRDQDDLRIVGDWLERGEWHLDALPERLRPVLPTAVSSRRN